MGIRHLTWFGAVAGAAEQGPSIRWTEAERAALLAAGVRLPTDGAERQVEQEAWIHAVLAASERLDVVSWLSSGSESVEPHPMLDLWSTRLPDGALDAIRSTTRAWLHDGTHDESVPIPAAPGVQPRAMWRVPAGALDLNRKWSASSIETLIRCPLQWTLTYAADLRTGDLETLPALRNLTGSFAHALFEEVLFEPEPGWDALTPEGARERLLQRFSERVDTEAAVLTLPENETFGGQIRERLGHAAAALVSQLKDGGWRPHAAEQKLPELGARFAGSPMLGSIDLVVKHRDGRLGVIDLKLGGSSYRRRTLREGTALQLAVYGKAAAQATGVFPPVAYFILEDGELLTTDEAAFPSASHQAGLDGAETMAAVDAAWSWWARTLEAGVVTGRGTHLSDDIDHEALDALSEAPPDHPWVDKLASCHFCDLERLCTFSLDGGAS